VDTEKETDAGVEESDEWFYNYFGRDNVAKVKEEGRKEGRKEGREEERRKNILNMLRLHYSITSIGNALQMPEDEVIRIARENNIPVSD
jgi:predicted transposase YdaD